MDSSPELRPDSPLDMFSFSNEVAQALFDRANNLRVQSDGAHCTDRDLRLADCLVGVANAIVDATLVQPRGHKMSKEIHARDVTPVSSDQEGDYNDDSTSEDDQPSPALSSCASLDELNLCLEGCGDIVSDSPTSVSPIVLQESPLTTSPNPRSKLNSTTKSPSKLSGIFRRHWPAGSKRLSASPQQTPKLNEDPKGREKLLSKPLEADENLES